MKLNILLILLTFVPLFAFSQQSNDARDLNARDFDLWLESELENMGYYIGTKNLINPKSIEDIFFQRIERGIYSSNDAYLKLVEANKQYQISLIAKKGIVVRDSISGEDMSFASTLKLINSFTNVLYKRPLLKVKLMKEKAVILNGLGREDEAIKIYEDELNTLGKISIETTKLNGLFNNRIGYYYLTIMDNPKKAINFYSATYKIPPYSLNYNFEDEEIFTLEKLKRIHLEAGKGLIRSNTNDLNGLKRLFILPSDKPVLQPLLEAAIKQAEGR